MKTFTILLLTVFMNACGSSKEVASNLTDASINTKMAQTSLTIKYSTTSRGSSTNFTVTENKVTYQLNRTDKSIEMPMAKKDWSELMDLMKVISLKEISNIKAPSKAHQYDGAAAAVFTVINSEGVNYNAPTFDAGNPNKIIAPIINKIMSLIPVK